MSGTSAPVDFERIPIQSDGLFVHTEIIAKANFMTLWMDEVPIGAQGGVPPAALEIPFNLRERCFLIQFT